MASRGPSLLSSLPNLQNLVKRDPSSYTDEFLIQWAHYNALRNIVEQGISTANTSTGKAGADEERFRHLVAFVAQTAACYPKHTADLPSHFSNLLLRSHANLSSETRKTLIHSIVLLRNRGVITGQELLKTLFPLLSMTTSSSIRAFILKTILSDVKNANAKTQNHKFNRLVQGLLYDMIERSSSASGSASSSGVQPKSVADYSGTGTRKSHGVDQNAGKEAMWAVKLASELWRKGTWKDARTANLLSAACFHSNTKVQSSAMHFFLDASGAKGLEGNDSDEDSDEDQTHSSMNKIRAVKHRQEINKKKRSSERAAKKEIKRANAKRKAQELKEANGEVTAMDNSALLLIHDPQSFAEKLYDLLVKNDKRFTLDHKVLIMQLFGRLSGIHKLSVLPFYSYVNKYLVHSQLQITTILVALASSVHELVPPDCLIPVIRKLAHEFVHPGVSSQVIAAGLNSIREICKRQIWAMEHDLLEDLVDYRKSKDKGIMVASRALLQLYRDQMPDMLRKRERGKAATMAASATGRGKGADVALHFGQQKDAQTSIEGLDLLEEYLSEKKAEKADANGAEGNENAEDEEEEADGWELDSSASEDSEGGWVAVSSDEEDGAVFDDSEDEDTRVERRARKKVKFSKAQDAESDSDSDGEDEAKAPEAGVTADALEVTKDELTVLDKEKENAGPKLSLAATKILTPADFAKLNELRTAAAEAEVKAGGGGAAKRKLALLQAAKKSMRAADAAGDGSAFLTESEIIGASKKAKADYEERMASIAKGREGREKFGSNKGKKKKENPSSTTNKEKRKTTKAFAMVAHSREVRGKGRASLRAKQNRLRGFSKSQKKNAAQAARL